MAGEGHKRIGGQEDVVVLGCNRVIIRDCVEVFLMNSYGKAIGCQLKVLSCDIEPWARDERNSVTTESHGDPDPA